MKSASERGRTAARTLAEALKHLHADGSGERAAGAHFRQMVDQSTHAIALLAPNGGLLEANLLGQKSLQMDPSQQAGALIWDAAGWADAPNLKTQLRTSVAAAARGVAVRHDTELPGADGALVIDLSFSPILSDDGEVVLLLAEWIDVTERKRTERALRESEERFHQIVALAVDAIISIDERQQITLFNAGAEKIFGFTEAEMIGKPLDLLLPKELAHTHSKEVRAFGESSDVSRRMGQRRQIFGRRKNGEVFSAEASISKVTVNGQRMYTAMLRDVSERWAAEQEKTELLATAQTARDAAEHAARQRDEMLGIVSHDLRNPLSAVQMCAGILADGDTPPDERRRLAETIHESVEWTQRLISDLMDISNIEAGKLSVERRPVDPIMILGRVLSLFEHQLAERSIVLNVGGLEHLPEVSADPERLLQALANFLGNALKFTPRGGAISVGAEVANGSVVFSVRDTGPGISADDLPHVFERRWHGGKPGTHGSGLGLAIARGIVQAHGGKIWVESTLGQGSLFQFSVPL